MKYVFLLKVNDNDNDCVKYLDLSSGRFECGHYFASVRISGACFSGFEKELQKVDYKNFKTILTEEELNELWKLNDEITELGYGIEENSERYNKGLEIKQGIQNIIDKLLSEENQKLFEEVMQEEKEWLANEYNLTEEEIDDIWDNYGLDYRDRATISYIFDDFDEFAEETAMSYGVIANDMAERYFDYETWGNDLLDNDEYYELNDGRIVKFSY